MNKRALIVEDDVNIAELLMLYLEKDGFDVSIAHDGGKGMAMFNELNPDLVLLDVMMPVMDGYQALVGIRNIEKERNIPEEKMVKVIMTTALNDEKNVKMAFDLGCTIYSGKPIDQERFEQALKKLGLIES